MITSQESARHGDTVTVTFHDGPGSRTEAARDARRYTSVYTVGQGRRVVSRLSYVGVSHDTASTTYTYRLLPR